MRVKRFELLVVLEAAVGADHDPAGVPSATNASEQLLDEAGGAALRVCFAFAVADMQHLAGVGASREDRVVAEPAGVAVGRALLLITVDLADEAVDVDHQRQLTRSRAGIPGPPERPVDDQVELADMPERERPQERPERRRRHHPVPQDQLRAPGAEHVHVIDAVRASEHAVHQRHHLPARQRRPRHPVPQPHRLVHQILDPEAVRQRRS